MGHVISRRALLKSGGGALALSGLTGCLSDDDDQAEWVIGGSPEGSPVNVWLEAFASEVEEHSDTLSLAPQPYGGGWRSLTASLADGEYDLATQNWYYQVEAQNDEGPYADDGAIGPVDPLPVGVTPTLHEQNLLFVTYADNDDVEELADLEGAMVGGLAPGTAVYEVGEEMRMEVGVDWDWESGSFGDLGSMITEERVDAAIILVTNRRGTPEPLLRAMDERSMKGIDIPGDAVSALDDHPFFDMIDFSGDDLPVDNEIENTPTSSLGTSIMTTEEHSSDLVYELLDVLIGQQEELADYHDDLQLFGIGDDRNNFTGIADGVMFHDGAIEYFEDEGIDYPS